MADTNIAPEVEVKPESRKVIVHCCFVCKKFGKGITLFNVKDKAGKKSQACQHHAGRFERIKR